MKHILPLAVVTCALFYAGCGKQKQTAPPQTNPEVSTTEIKPEKIVLKRKLSGRTSPLLIAEIRPQISGIIMNRLFEEGADVNAGDILYEIDHSLYRANVMNAKAAVALAEANYATALAAHKTAEANLKAMKAAEQSAEAIAAPLHLRFERFNELVKISAVSQQDFDDVASNLKQAEAGIASAKANVQAAQAEVIRAKAATQAAKATITSAQATLETARINLGYTKITAPISGRIGRSTVTTGALVTAHQPVPLATIQKLDPIYVDVPQASAELLHLQRRLADGRLSQNGSQQTVRLELEDGSAYPLEGTLKFREVTVDPSSGSFILRMEFPNPDRTLLPGMFVRAVVEEGVKEDALLIPQQAVVRDPKGNPIAMVVGQQGVVQQQMLTIDRAVGDRWLVSSGLVPKTHVIMEGLQRVRPGMTVKEVPFGAADNATVQASSNASATATTN